MPEKDEGCVQPARGPISAGPAAVDEESMGSAEQEEVMVARVGSTAPDFEATAFADGTFKTIQLSEYKGKWVVLCFYPGDFTFV